MQSGFVDVDCAYFDPPYGGASSDYAALYRFFEEYIYEQPLEDLPHYEKMQRFSKKKNYGEHFEQMLEAARSIPTWIFSCNDSSWEGLDHIVKLVKKFKKNVIVESILYGYKYRDKKKKGRISENEHLILAT